MRWPRPTRPATSCSRSRWRTCSSRSRRASGACCSCASGWRTAARTLEEVGRDFGVTRERIRQIEAKALRKLRHPSRSRKLKDYLE